MQTTNNLKNWTHLADIIINAPSICWLVVGAVRNSSKKVRKKTHDEVLMSTNRAATGILPMLHQQKQALQNITSKFLLLVALVDRFCDLISFAR